MNDRMDESPISAEDTNAYHKSQMLIRFPAADVKFLLILLKIFIIFTVEALAHDYVELVEDSLL